MEGFGGGGRIGKGVTPNELVFTFGGFYVRANYGQNRSRNVRKCMVCL